MRQNETILNYLETEFTEPVRDPVWGHIYLSPSLLKVISTPQFRRLDGIRQLGPAALVYPGATHTRMSHSLGVFHLAYRMIRVLFSRAGNKPEPQIFTLEGVRAFLTAALLHDLGHFPFAHSLKELPLAEHEELTGRIILGSELKPLIRNEVGADPFFTAAIIDESLHPPGDNAELQRYRRLLSGVLDPDKLDYLTRDAGFCGVPYGIQDTDFVLDQMRLDSAGNPAVGQGGISAVEHVLFSKYLMYRTVYWHKTVRSATAMIKRAMHAGLNDGIVSVNELYGLDDRQFLETARSKSYPPFQLISDALERKLFKAIVEVPFDPANANHPVLENLEERSRIEKMAAERLGVPEIIIDLPEPISFESELTVIGESGEHPVTDSRTIFSAPAVSDISATLRVIRVFVEPGSADSFGPELPDALSEIL
ncbi:MAG: HD domain-containing protein [Spirochaetales bacterium]|nr:HD domain-containing protein [Spirochaetales bacterium]MCF7937921.1 HD domain-containing protein [Spirochaetales bacterium]